ncbi:MAG: hypothetical protein ACXADB_05680 [Candidatus Hermodarchaeia archaeon]|jgi:hypothetical protein
MMNFWPIGVDAICLNDKIIGTTSQNLMGETVELMDFGFIYQHYYLSRFTSWPYHIQALIDKRSIPPKANYLIVTEGGYVDYGFEMPLDKTPDFLEPIMGKKIYTHAMSHHEGWVRASLLQRWVRA